jgi:outer membrane protein OmpA-like peptidoglycan-associated protein
MQMIYIPGLDGTIQVYMSAWFDPGPGEIDFSGGFDATHKLADQKRTTNLKIQVQMIFPTHTWRATGHKSQAYSEFVHGKFSNIEQTDGKLIFSNTEVMIQALGPPSPPGAHQSLFRYLEGKAWLSASNNPGIAVVKIRLVLGSPDVYVKSWEETHEDAQWKVEVGKDGAKEAGVGSWVKDRILGPGKVVIDTIRKFSGKVERSGAVDKRTTGMQFTPGQLSVQPEWILSLVLPELKPPPQPVTHFMRHKVYFLTGKSDLNGVNNDPRKFPDQQDQIKSLQRFLDSYQARFADRDFKYLESIELIGHASGLGDTGGNLTLSESRANYVKQLIWMTNRINIPEEKIKARGKPYAAGDKDNNPEDRRVDVQLFARK